MKSSTNSNCQSPLRSCRFDAKQSKYGEDNNLIQSTQPVKFINIDQLQQNVPTMYGKKNSRYVSPTYASDCVMYGSNSVRKQKENLFTTNQTLLLSPNQDQRILLQNEKCESTNQFSPFENAFYKNHLTANYKNFSQIEIGENRNIESAYRHQFKKQKSTKQLMLNLQQIEQKYGNKSPKAVEMKEEQELEFNFKSKSFSRNFQSSKTQYQIPPKPSLTVKHEDKKQFSFFEFSPNSIKQGIPQKQNMQSSITQGLTPKQSSKYQCHPSKENYRDEQYGFFSPQIDPFKSAYQKKSLLRCKSQDRVQNAHLEFIQENKYRQEKKKMQNLDSINQQAFQRVRQYKEPESKIASLIGYNQQHSYKIYPVNQIVYSNEVTSKTNVQNSFQESNRIFQYSQKNQQFDQVSNKSITKGNVGENESNLLREKKKNLENVEDLRVEVIQDKINELDQRKKELIKNELWKSYQDNLFNKERQKMKFYEVKNKERQMIDQAFEKGQQLNSAIDSMRKQQAVNCASYCKEQINNQSRANARGGGYKSITQRLFGDNSFIENMKSPMHINKNNQNFYQMKENNLGSFGQCASNASTISGCSLVSKSDISTAEFELRKKQIQSQKEKQVKMKGKDLQKNLQKMRSNVKNRNV